MSFININLFGDKLGDFICPRKVITDSEVQKLATNNNWVICLEALIVRMSNTVVQDDLALGSTQCFSAFL